MTDTLYQGLTAAHYYDAFQVMHGAAMAAWQAKLTNRYAGTVVALKPHAQPSSNNPLEVSLQEVMDAAAYMGRLDADFREELPDGRVLTSESFDEFALTKARDLWVTGSNMGLPYFTSHEIAAHPELYVPGMTHYVGGVWNRSRVTTFSGVQGEYDVMFAQTYDAAITAQARLAMVPVLDRTTNTSGFIGGDGSRDPMFIRI